MTAKELKKYIFQNQHMISILEHLKMHHINDSNSKYISCGFEDGDNISSTIIYKDEYCKVVAYTRDIKDKENKKQFTDIINLTAFVFNLTYQSAKSYLMSFLGLSNTKSVARKQDQIPLFRNIKRKQSNQVQKEQVYYDVSLLDQYSDMIHIDLIRKDGLIDVDILRKYNIMFDTRTNRILFPHFKWDDSSKICGIVGRTVNPSFKELQIKKYMSVLLTEYIKTSNLYALCWNMEYILKERKIIIFEAEKSVLKSDMFGFPFAVSVGLHDISDVQKKIILSLDIDEVIIAFDNDVEEKYIQSQCSKFNKYIKTSYICDKWDLLGEKDSPVDKGHRRWKYLFRHRINYNKVS